MRWAILFSALFLFLIVISLNAKAQNPITGETITGEATQTFGINISVLTEAPTMVIEKPRNETYFTNTSLKLDLEIENAQTVWYNLDRAANTSFTNNELTNEETTFNASEGGHALYVFANNSDNEVTSKNVNFSISLSLFNYSYDEYEGGNKGNSTYFKNMSYTEIQDITNFILEHTSYGKIFFNENINLTDDSNFSDSFVYIDEYTNLSFNRIEIDLNYLPNLNKPSTLRLYNLSFTNPRLTKDSVACPSTICVKQSYNSTTGELVFNVTGFSVYSSEETPASEGPQTSPAATGTAGGGSADIKTFSVNKNRIEISLKQGETKQEELTIENTGNEDIQIDLSSLDISEFIKISDPSFSLKKQESKIITLEFTAKKSHAPALYIGKLLIKKDVEEREIPIIIEVESADALFDLIIEIPEKYRFILPGGIIPVNIKIFELREIGRVDVEIEYTIRDNKNNIITSEKDTISVYKQADFVKSLSLPKDIKDGDYILYANVKYDEKIASSSESFIIQKEILFFLLAQKYLYIIIIIILIILLIMFYEILKIKRWLRIHGKIDDDKIIKKNQ